LRDNGGMDTMTGQDVKSDGGEGARGVFVARIAENYSVCRDPFMIYFDIKDFPASAPGQFVNIGPIIGQTGEPLQPARPLLKRPFSILSREDAGGAARIGVLYRVLGFGTGWMRTLRPGDAVQVIGPLGRSFRVPDGIRTALLVAGGTGIAPLIYLAARLKSSHPHVRIAMFEGVRSKSLLPLRTDLGQPCPDPKVISSDVADIPVVIASDDGTVGHAGTVVDAADRWIAANVETADGETRRQGDKEKPQGTGDRGQGTAGEEARRHADAQTRGHGDTETRRQGDPASPDDGYAVAGKGAAGESWGVVTDETCVFACGPEPMMAAMAAVCERRGLRCQVSLEKSMACGMGTCQSCVVKVKDAADPDGWVYKLCCKDGPPFDASQVVWK
jgi:NAD(P)H-flavin reductase